MIVLPIKQITKDSWLDLKRLITNPLIIILFLISGALPVLKDFLWEQKNWLSLLTIPLILLILFFYAYQTKLIYNLKNSETQNIFTYVLFVYPRYLGYSMLYAIITILLLYPLLFMSYAPNFFTLLLVLICIPTAIYICAKLFFSLYLVILKKDTTPIKSSWAITKNDFGGLLVLFLWLGIISVMIMLPFLVLLMNLNIKENMLDILLIPANSFVELYAEIALINTFVIYYDNYHKTVSKDNEPLSVNLNNSP